VGFEDTGLLPRAEVALEAADLDGATVLPSPPDALPVADGGADVVLFVLHVPDPAERTEARRVAGATGRVVVVTPGFPWIGHEGPAPELDAALWGVCRAASLVPPGLEARSASTHVVTQTVAGSRSGLVALLLERLTVIQRVAGLGDLHPAVRRLAHALEAFASGPDGVGSYEVPLVARVLA